MKNPKQLELLINTAGAIVVLSVIGYIAYTALHIEAQPTCSARYPAGMRFSLQNSEGKPLSAIELQARAGLRDLGVIDNASVVRIDNGPSPEALEVKLRKLPEDADAGDRARNGIAFRWSPPGMENATAACLSYGVWFPDKFAFGVGGFLPGVFGGAGSSSQNSTSEELSASPHWGGDGKPLLSATLRGGATRQVSGRSSPLPTSRWIKVEMEVALNDPGLANGSLRLWIDGELVSEDQAAALRKDAEARLTGILVGVGYRRVADNPGSVRLSPLEVSWR